MQSHQAKPEPKVDTPIADADRDNWVDTWAPAPIRPYLRLSRADRPIGTWLLLIPCWWGLALAMMSDGQRSGHDAWIALGCALGAWLMRGAGCTWNDINDRKIDAKVARTRGRPLPSGQVSLRQALAWMVLQALLAFAILLSFNTTAIGLGILALVPVAIYPFAKRVTWWPQVFLGIAFNWGVLVAWTAHHGTLEAPALLLYAAGIAWTLFYDTIYAHQDAEDDALIGVKSTARLFGDASVLWLRGFALITVVLFACAVAIALPPGPHLWIMLAALLPSVGLGAHLAWQLRRFDPQDGASLLHLFRSNRNAGMIPLVLLAALLFI